VVAPWCESCNEREAARHYRINLHGEDPQDFYLCVECARRRERTDLWPQEGLLISDLLGRLMAGSEDASLFCPTCRQDVEDLVRYGRAGCTDCYAAFRAEVEEKLYGSVGRARHRGKVPRQI
jgi:protein arginine kinase activator